MKLTQCNNESTVQEYNIWGSNVPRWAVCTLVMANFCVLKFVPQAVNDGL